MSKEKKNVPRLRFPGFTGEWEQRKLENLCDVFTDGDWIESKDQSDSGIRLVQTGNVGITEYLDKEDNKKWISEETFERLHCEEIFEGDILISRLPEPAGRACIMPYLGTRMITAVDCTIVRTKPEYESNYLVQYLSTPMYFKAVNSFLGGGTRQRISRGNLSGIGVPTPPTTEEQSIIGEFCANIDKLIILHQRKLDQMKEYKKGMLQKMFPKKGETVPEIRFPGFVGDWEQKKLENICERVTRKNKNGESDLPLTISSQDGLVDQRTFFNKVVASKDMSNYYLLKKGEFAYNKSYSKGYDYGSIKRLNAYKMGCLSTLYICFALTSNVVDSDYLEYYFDTLQWYEDIALICAEGARNHGLLNVDTNAFFEDVTVYIPNTIEEQKKISGFLISMDTAISLQQRKLDRMKEYKKGLLQQMFV